MRSAHCALCETPFGDRDLRCPACGAYEYVWVELPDADEDLTLDEAPPPVLDGPLGEALGFELPQGRCLMLHGVAGGGKTRTALVSFPHAALVTNEMDEPSTRDYRVSLGLDPDCLILEAVYANSEDEDLYDVPEGSLIGFKHYGTHGRDMMVDPNQVGDLIFDSISEAPDPVLCARGLKEYAENTGSRVIGIVQENADGTPKGGTKIPHLFWSQVRMETDELGNVVARVVKNRSGQMGQVVLNLSKGAKASIAEQYYTVEGKRGAYELRVWPDRKSSWGDYYKLATKQRNGEFTDDALLLQGRMPNQLPMATCARQNPLDTETGFTEPADWTTRARFALGMGVPYWSPLRGLFTHPAELADYEDT